MATRPTLHVAVEKTKNTASDYNDNFDMMMNFIDDSIGEAKGYVDDFMPSVTGQSGKFLTNDGTNTSWTSLSGKANTNLANCTSGAFTNVLALATTANKKVVNNWGMPDYSNGTTKNWNTQYTASNNCYLTLTNTTKRDDDGFATIKIVYGGTTKTFCIGGYSDATDHEYFTATWLIPKNAKYKFTDGNNGKNFIIEEFPLIGE